MPNGSSGESSRKKHKDQEVRVRVRLGGKIQRFQFIQLISNLFYLSYLILMGCTTHWNAPHAAETLPPG